MSMPVTGRHRPFDTIGWQVHESMGTPRGGSGSKSAVQGWFQHFVSIRCEFQPNTMFQAETAGCLAVTSLLIDSK
jgi:hypothetical protein